MLRIVIAEIYRMRCGAAAIVLVAVLALSGCTERAPESSVSEPETVPVTQPMTEQETEIDFVTEPVTEIAPEEPFLPVSDLDIGEPDVTYFMNQYKSVIPAIEGGYYYYAFVGGWDSAHDMLAYDSGDGNYVTLDNTDFFNARYYSDGVLWGSTYIPSDGYYGLCTYVGGEFFFPGHDGLGYPYFTPGGIYALTQDKTLVTFYLVDYITGKAKEAAVLKTSHLPDYVVCGNRLFYEYYDSSAGNTTKSQHTFGVIDLETGEASELSDGGTGIVCGNYMYYTDWWSFGKDCLCRISLDDYSVEKLCEDANIKAVHDGYIFYCVNGYRDSEAGVTSDVLWRLGKGENAVVLEPNMLLGDEYYYGIDTVQSEGRHLYVKLSSGPYYSNIIEIDTDGNIIKQIYKHSGT